jgi:hypothetical protein
LRDACGYEDADDLDRLRCNPEPSTICGSSGAFRVGEYIQSGNYKGTVEGFSIRSVRLRHHRGPVYTVPFSLLGPAEGSVRSFVISEPET